MLESVVQQSLEFKAIPGKIYLKEYCMNTNKDYFDTVHSMNCELSNRIIVQLEIESNSSQIKIISKLYMNGVCMSSQQLAMAVPFPMKSSQNKSRLHIIFTFLLVEFALL